jgi:PAS domain S-box-containing protein
MAKKRTLDTIAMTSTTDEKGIITDVNDSLCKISGYKRRMLIGKTHKIIASGIHTDKFFSKIWNIISSGKPWRGEICNRTRDGEIFWVDSMIMPQMQEGSVIGYTSVSFRATQRKKLKQKLRAAIERNKAMSQSAKFAIITMSLDGSITGFNRRAEAMLGYNSSEVVGLANQLLFHDSDELSKMTKILSDEYGQDIPPGLGTLTFRANKGECDESQWIFIRKDGAKINVRLSMTALHSRSGKTIGYMGIAKDITQDLIKESINDETQQLLTNALRTLPVAVFAKDVKDGFKFNIWNRAAETMFGLSASDCIGKTDYDFFPKAQADFFRNKDVEACNSVGILDIPTEPANLAKGPGILHTRKIVIRDSEGKPSILLGICEDITDQIESQRLIEEQKVKLISASNMSSIGEMAAGIAHEINNPLAITIGRAGLLLSQLEANQSLPVSKIIESLNIVIKSTNRAAKIIAGMKELSRDAESDQMVPSDINHSLNDALALCRERFKKHGITLVVVPSGPANYMGRPVQLSQVFMNLLNNSFDAVVNESKKWVNVSVSLSAGSIRIEFSDSGQPIDKIIRDKIMQPFFTTKEVGKGIGLGLSISRQIISSHGGSLYLDDSRPSTTFVIELPQLSMASPIAA